MTTPNFDRLFQIKSQDTWCLRIGPGVTEAAGRLFDATEATTAADTKVLDGLMGLVDDLLKPIYFFKDQRAIRGELVGDFLYKHTGYYGTLGDRSMTLLIHNILRNTARWKQHLNNVSEQLVSVDRGQNPQAQLQES
jgi:hypothetical protein